MMERDKSICSRPVSNHERNSTKSLGLSGGGQDTIKQTML